jgi:hypothetical protein
MLHIMKLHCMHISLASCCFSVPSHGTPEYHVREDSQTLFPYADNTTHSIQSRPIFEEHVVF